MKKIQLNINEYLDVFDKGVYEQRVNSEEDSVKVAIDMGFYDWFCKETSIYSKAVSLTKKLKRIKNSSKIDCKNSYVFFKNNCPMNGSLYDDFRICDIKTNDVIFTIIPKSGHKVKNGLGEVWGKDNDFCGPLFKGSWKEIINWFDKSHTDES